MNEVNEACLHPLVRDVDTALDLVEAQLRSARSQLRKMGVPPQTRREVEAEWSDVLALLHPHQREDESIYETAKRVIPNAAHEGRQGSEVRHD